MPVSRRFEVFLLATFLDQIHKSLQMQFESDRATWRAMTYMPQLDGLRALAVAAVAVQHWGTDQIKVFRFSLGEIGVGLFFVLSGFLITNILLRIRASNGKRTTGIGLRRFWIRRILRIFPVFYLTILCGIILDIPSIADYRTWHFLYGSNFLYSMGTDLPGAAHFWTLAVEEQFYLFWPILILYVPKKSIPHVMVACILFAVGWRFLAGSVFIPMGPFINAVPLLPSQLDFLCFGALLSWFVANPGTVGPANFSKTIGLIGVAGVVGLSSIDGLWPLNVVFLVMVFCSVVYWASQGIRGPIGKLLQFAPIVYVGKISYGIYIFHNIASLYWNWFYYAAPIPGYRIFFHLGIADEGALHTAFKVLILAGVTVALASASWYLVESPINRLKRFFPYKEAVTEARVAV